MKLNFPEKLLLIINTLCLIFQLMLMGSIPSFFEFSILNLFVPIVVIINIGFFIYWLLKSKWVFLLFMISFLIGYGEWGLLYQFPRTLIHKSTNTFKVMTYNVRLFNKFDWIKDTNVSREIERFISQEQPDIICFQEYSKSKAPALLSYPYSYIQPIQSNGKSEIAIFSKFAILNSGYINFKNSTNSGIFTDIEHRGKIARVYNLHLQSLRINFKDTLITQANSDGLQLRFNQVFKKQLEQIKIQNIINDKTKNIVKDTKLSNFILRYQVLDELPSKELRNIVDQGKKEIKEGIIISFCKFEEKVGVAVGITSKLIDKYNAVTFVKEAAEILGGKGGGGRKDFAQAGGVNKDKIDEAYKALRKKIN